MASVPWALVDGFAHPALAFGALLAAVPLVIHLLNRQRHRPLAWAAMRFVAAAYRRTRRRARLESLILLLLRMAGVALLAFAVARPFTGGASPLAALAESRRDLVVVLDGSASMGWRGATQSVFERAVDRARALVGELEGGRGDRVRLVLAGAHPRLLSWRSPDEAMGLLGALNEPADEGLDLVAALAEVLGYVEEDAAVSGRGALEIRLLTDLQRASFVTRVDAPELEAGAAAPRLAEVCDALREAGARVLVEDLGPGEPRPANLAVEAIEVDAGRMASDLPFEVAVTVFNSGPTLQSDVRVALEVNGERRPSRTIEVPARGRARALFSVQIKASGDHVLAARLDSDRLEVDDQRARVVRIPPPVRVLLVDGQPAFEVDRDETGYLALVLAPPGDGATDLVGGRPAPFAVRTVLPGELRRGDLDLAEFDVIVLANVGSLETDTARALEERVAAGAALWITAGDALAANAEIWNRRLFRADGSGLLPAELGAERSVVDRRRDWWRVAEFQMDHPALAFFADERWRPLWTEVPIYQFLSARPLPDARVLARLDDQAASPLLIERAFDRGRVFLWTTSIDADWARVAESPRTLVPFVHELVRYAGTPPVPERNVEVGQPFAAEVASFPRVRAVLRPDGTRRPLEGEPQTLAPGLWRLPPVLETDRAGLYEIELEGQARLPFAVGFDPAESDLERLAPGQLAELHPVFVAVGARPDRAAAQDEGDRAQGELWRLLAGLCLAALVAESLWAAWMGRRRALP
ncbi:MAG TPA: BatA domain-containing protein [Planctomycetota bacterium]|nr:BatA domain-containing protein [Planctomycetota bacterium]